MEYTNENIDIDSIPVIDDESFIPLDHSYLKLRMIVASIFNAVLILGFVIFILFDLFTVPFVFKVLISALLVIRVFWSYIYLFKSFKFKSYLLREKDISYKTGWLWQSLITIPFNRIQHVQIDQGPLERRMKLSSLKVYTAGGQSSDMTIPGLLEEDALRIKKFIVSKAGDEEE